MISRRSLPLLAIGVLVCAVSQAHAQKLDVDRLRDSLQTQQSVVDLRKREQAIKRITGRSPERMMERGLVLLRLYELTRKDHDLDDARDLFQKATKARPDARAYYALGLSLAIGHGSR